MLINTSVCSVFNVSNKTYAGGTCALAMLMNVQSAMYMTMCFKTLQSFIYGIHKTNYTKASQVQQNSHRHLCLTFLNVVRMYTCPRLASLLCTSYNASGIDKTNNTKVSQVQQHLRRRHSCLSNAYACIGCICVGVRFNDHNNQSAIYMSVCFSMASISRSSCFISASMRSFRNFFIGVSVTTDRFWYS